MLSIADYPYLHNFFSRAVSTYGPWLTQNRNTIAVDLRGRTELSSTMVKSITSKIAHFVMTDPRIDFYRHFHLLDNRKSISNSLPEIVTQAWFPIDLSQLRGINHQLDAAVSTNSELEGKILLDVAPYSNRDLAFNNLPALHRHITRDYLCRTFYAENQVWWSIDFILNLAAIYSIAAGERGVAAQHLDMRTLMKIRLIFAMYFVAQCVQPTTGTLNIIDYAATIIHNGYKLIVPQAFMEEMEVRELVDAFKTILREHDDGSAYKTGMTLDHVIALMKAMGNNRLVGIEVNVLRSANQKLLSSPVESFAALEYPPMFAYGVLSALSAFSAGNIGFTMQKTAMLKPVITNLRNILNKIDIFPTNILAPHAPRSSSTTKPSAPTQSPPSSTTTTEAPPFNPFAL